MKNKLAIGRILAFAAALIGHQFNAPAQPVLVSTNPAAVSVTASGDSISPVVSRDGRYVLFSSSAGNLATNSSGAPYPALVPAKLNLFLYDRTNSTTSLVSVSADGATVGNGDSYAVAISTNGQFVLFESAATNLVAGDTNNVNDIFVRDVLNHTTTLVSVGTNGVVGNGVSRNATMTPDGRYVAFVSAATNLVAGDTNGIDDVFVRDLQAGNTVWASAGAKNANAFSTPSSSESPDISDNGQYVAFFSSATNLVAGITNTADIFVRDLVNNVTLMASTNARSIALSVYNTNTVGCSTHLISGDGQYVAFVINVKTVTSAFPAGILVRHHLLTGSTDIINNYALGAPASYQNYGRSIDMSPDGKFIAFITNNYIRSGTTALPDALVVWNAQFNSTTAVTSNAATSSSPPDFYWPQISDDGRYVSFFSSVTNLTTNSISTNGGNFGFHLYSSDTQSNTITMVDPRLDGSAAGYASPDPQSVSASGQVIVFDSLEPGLVANDANRSYDVFLYDAAANALQLVSAPNPVWPSITSPGQNLIASQSISSDGRYFAFTSEAENLVANDTNLCRDVFVHDQVTGAYTLVSVATNGFSGNNVSSDSALSADGRYVAFTSSASNLVTGDTNNARDVFLRNLVAETTTAVSVATNGVLGNADSYSPTVSSDGRYVLFYSKASNLRAGFTTTNYANVFRRDVVAATTFAFVTNTGTASTVVAAASPDGRFVVVGGYVSGSFTNYVWDMQATNRIYTNVASGGDGILAINSTGTAYAYITATTGNVIYVNITSNLSKTLSVGAVSSHPTLQFSADGRYLLFGSGGTGKTNQIVLYDSQTGTTNVVSTAFNSSGGASSNSDWATISPDGHFIAYRSSAPNLVPGDLNSNPDVFLYNRLTAQTTLVSVNQNGNASGNSRSFAPMFSPDSQTLFFTSWASDLTAQDFNQAGDIYAFSLADPNAQPVIILTFTAPATINWNATAGKNYQVQFKNNLTDLSWQSVNGTVSVIGNSGSITDLSPSPTQKFYRVIGN